MTVASLLLALLAPCALHVHAGTIGLGRLSSPPLLEGAVRTCARDLALNRFTVLHNFINVEDISDVRADLDGRYARGEMLQAGVRGRVGGNDGGSPSAVISSIRNAVTVWLDNSKPQTAVESNLLLFLDVLRMQLAEELRLDLSLEDTEVLYARYPVGGFYATHSDSHSPGSPWGLQARSTERMLSFVLYVNEQPWARADGGQLRMHGREVDSWARSVDVPPTVGSLVLFLSQDFR